MAGGFAKGDGGSEHRSLILDRILNPSQKDRQN
jgi:hypothetical protein